MCSRGMPWDRCITPHNTLVPKHSVQLHASVKPQVFIHVWAQRRHGYILLQSINDVSVVENCDYKDVWSVNSLPWLKSLVIFHMPFYEDNASAEIFTNGTPIAERQRERERVALMCLPGLCWSWREKARIHCPATRWDGVTESYMVVTFFSSQLDIESDKWKTRESCLLMIPHALPVNI